MPHEQGRSHVVALERLAASWRSRSARMRSKLIPAR